MCLCQSVYLSNCPRPHLVGIDQRDHCVEILSDSQRACVSRSICFLVRALSKASLSQRDKRGPCVGIDTLAVNSPLLSLYSTIIHHTLLSKCINICLQEYLPSIMTFLTGKLIFKNKFENLFSKQKTGFLFSKKENWISGFRLTSLT